MMHVFYGACEVIGGGDDGESIISGGKVGGLGTDSKVWPNGAVVVRCTRSLSGELDVAEFPIIMGEKLGLACGS